MLMLLSLLLIHLTVVSGFNNSPLPIRVCVNSTEVESIVRSIVQREVENMRGTLCADLQSRIITNLRAEIRNTGEDIISRLAVCSPSCVHGRCTGTNRCTCNTGWTGNACDKAICSHPCQNAGTCIAPNVCTCLAGYSGPRCQNQNCSPLCVHGICIRSGANYRCDCHRGWIGSTCNQEIPVCSPPCQNGGRCVAHNRCSCRWRYSGESCEDYETYE